MASNSLMKVSVNFIENAREPMEISQYPMQPHVPTELPQHPNASRASLVNRLLIAGNKNTTPVPISRSTSGTPDSPAWNRVAERKVQLPLFSLEQPVSDGLNQRENTKPNLNGIPQYWAALRYQHTAAIRAVLMGNFLKAV